MNVALIGNGYWGSILHRYIKDFFDITWVINTSVDSTRMWKDKSVEAVFIATPVHTHFELAKKALLMGKHVFVEKPLTTDLYEALYLKNLAERVDKQLVTDYTNTFSRSLNLIKNLTIASMITNISTSQTQFGRYTNENVFTVLGSHHLSILGMFTDLYKLEYSVDPLIFKDGICTTGRISYNGGEIFVSLDVNDKALDVRVVADKVYKFNHHGVYYGEAKTGFNESDNLQYAVKYFKDVIEDKAKSNLDTSIIITKIIGDI